MKERILKIFGSLFLFTLLIGCVKEQNCTVTKIYSGDERYFKIAKRIYADLDERLGQSEYLAGKNYTIADIATFPWIARHEIHDIGLKNFKNLTRWYSSIAKRDAVIKGFDFLKRGENVPAV